MSRLKYGSNPHTVLLFMKSLRKPVTLAQIGMMNSRFDSKRRSHAMERLLDLGYVKRIGVGAYQLTEDGLDAVYSTAQQQ
jgi:Mn-dependent DtxR family transcriptional regulator